jgi:hypothetical protein
MRIKYRVEYLNNFFLYPTLLTSSLLYFLPHHLHSSINFLLLNFISLPQLHLFSTSSSSINFIPPQLHPSRKELHSLFVIVLCVCCAYCLVVVLCVCYAYCSVVVLCVCYACCLVSCCLDNDIYHQCPRPQPLARTNDICNSES